MIVAAIIAVKVRKAPVRPFWLERGQAEGAGRKLTEFDWFLVVIIVACLGVRTVASLLSPLGDWDGIVIWGVQGEDPVLQHSQDHRLFSSPGIRLLAPAVSPVVAADVRLGLPRVGRLG